MNKRLLVSMRVVNFAELTNKITDYKLTKKKYFFVKTFKSSLITEVVCQPEQSFDQSFIPVFKLRGHFLDFGFNGDPFRQTTSDLSLMNGNIKP